MVQGVKTPEGVIYEASPVPSAHGHWHWRRLCDANMLTLAGLKLASSVQVETGPPINTSIDDPDNQRFKEDDFRMLYMKVGTFQLTPQACSGQDLQDYRHVPAP